MMKKTLLFLVTVLQLHVAMQAQTLLERPPSNDQLDYISEARRRPPYYIRQTRNYPLPYTHYLLPQQLHVIPLHSPNQNSILVPIVPNIVQQTSSNGTHTTQLLPILLPIHANLVPQQNIYLQDMSVIPLRQESLTQSEHQEVGLLRSAEKASNEEEQMINRYRRFYGGYGNGLYFGGHGAGHGFYAYG